MNENPQNKNQLLNDCVKMDTQTVFYTNGDVNIYPCEWADEQVTRGGSVSTKGRMQIEEDGTSSFHAYRRSNMSRYTVLYQTENGVVKHTREKYIITLTLPIGMRHKAMLEALRRQVLEIISYMKSQNEDTDNV